MNACTAPHRHQDSFSTPPRREPIFIFLLQPISSASTKLPKLYLFLEALIPSRHPQGNKLHRYFSELLCTMVVDYVSRSETQLCSYCERHWFGECTEEERQAPDCPSCRLVANALPTNCLEDAENEMVEAPPRLWNFGRITTTTADCGREYGQLVRFSRLFVCLYHIDIAQERDPSHDWLPVDIPTTIDFDAVKSWLARCKKSHGRACDQLELPSRYSDPSILFWLTW
jgi:hypothetical protein